MALEHKLSAEQLHWLCVRDMAAYDQLPPALQHFIDDGPLGVDTSEVLKFWRAYGIEATMAAVSKAWREHMVVNPLCQGAKHDVKKRSR